MRGRFSKAVQIKNAVDLAPPPRDMAILTRIARQHGGDSRRAPRGRLLASRQGRQALDGARAGAVRNIFGDPPPERFFLSG
jgi:hypothetical protein